MMTFRDILRTLALVVVTFFTVDAATQLRYPPGIRTLFIVVAVIIALADSTQRASAHRALTWGLTALGAALVLLSGILPQYSGTRYSFLANFRVPVIVARSYATEIGVGKWLEQGFGSESRPLTDFIAGHSPLPLQQDDGLVSTPTVSIRFDPNGSSFPKYATVEWHSAFPFFNKPARRVPLKGWGDRELEAFFTDVFPNRHRHGGRELCGPSKNPDANRAFATGANLSSRSSISDIKLGVDSLERAVALDPSYDLAMAELANALARLVHREAVGSSEVVRAHLERAHDLAEQVIAHCPLSDLGWKARGTVLQADLMHADVAQVDRTLVPGEQVGAVLARALQSYNQAIKLNPYNFHAHCNMIALYGSMQQYGEAEESFRTATAILPSAATPFINFADVLIGRYRKTKDVSQLRRALNYLDVAERNNPRTGLVYLNRSIIYAFLKKYDLAKFELREITRYDDYVYAKVVHYEARQELPVLDSLYAIVRKEVPARMRIAEEVDSYVARTAFDASSVSELRGQERMLEPFTGAATSASTQVNSTGPRLPRTRKDSRAHDDALSGLP